ncbi:PREDICTED: F-box/FBD/LRR-repeat protein At1g13570-like [Nicotiana attenuata]|uniref:F-box/FBD/LRR-repeat protein At1g13570-like n=1 Tax=Nicotiana attenuata TaxID=49451 RepID=UPI0009055A86|nr:PREDICTED: F-box/FBD/LRR-repeat protein At1g13570-like [Nicotiana attenuata]
MMTNSYKRLQDGRNKLNRLTNLPINVKYQIQEHMTIEDAARMSVLSSKWRHIWASNPKLTIFADFCRKGKQSSITNIINRVLLHHYGPIKTFLLDLSIINPSEHSVIDLWMLHLSRNGLVDLTLKNPGNLNAPYKLPSYDCRNVKFYAVIPQQEVSQNRQHEAMDLVKLLSVLPNIGTLILDECSLKFLACGNLERRLSTMLNNLVNLEFHGFDFNDEDQICFLLCILRSSPNLKLLNLLLSRIKKVFRKVDVNQLKAQGCRIDELNNLRALKIHKFHASRAE